MKSDPHVAHVTMRGLCVLLLCFSTLPPDNAAAAQTGSSDAGDALFVSDFSHDPRQGNWARIQVVSPDRFSPDRNERTPHGKVAARVEVRPGDNPLTCCVSTERSEVLIMRSSSGQNLSETGNSGIQHFAISYKLPYDFKSADTGRGKWSILFQLHGGEKLSAPPAIALHASASQYFIRTNGGDLSNGNNFRTIRLTDPSLNLGRWTDLVMMIKFASDSTGQITVWRRNEGEISFRKVADAVNIPTLQFKTAANLPPGHHYWKQGLYRSAAEITNVIWIGPTARATSFEAAELAAFGTSSGKP